MKNNVISLHRDIFDSEKDLDLALIIRDRRIEHTEFHSGSFAGLFLSIDGDGEYLVSSIGKISKNQAIILLKQALGAVLIYDTSNTE